jgi:hypothetical protein
VFPIALAAVTVILNGRIIDSSQPAVLNGGMVMAPVDPFARRLAERITYNPERRTIRFERGERSIEIPIAPYVREDQAVIPLGLLARALGATVSYDAAHALIGILTPPANPLATMPPYIPVPPIPQPAPTFTPEPVVTPRPTVSGIPQPRRTPIWLEGPH